MSTIVEEEPFAAAVVTSHLASVCSNCFGRNDDRPLLRCSRCKQLRYCSSECQKKDWSIHKEECVCLMHVSPRIPTSMARLLGRLAIRRAKGDHQSFRSFNGRSLEDLMTHREEIEKDPERLEFFTCLSMVLREYLSRDLLPDTVTLLADFGRIVVNCFSITGDDQITIGEGVYVGLSALDHSCSPDAYVRFRGSKALLRSPRSGIAFNNSLTIPYTALDTLNWDRRQALKRQYYFTCFCSVCKDDQRDGRARSIRCSSCPSGICLVHTNSATLACMDCAAVQAIDPYDAIRANQEIEWFLEKKKDQSDETDLTSSLSSSISLFDRHRSLLSQANLPLASLAFRIINLSLALDRRDLALQYASSFLPAYKLYLPHGHPLLTQCLLTAAIAASYADPPSVQVLAMFEEAREACLLSHGPRDPECASADRQVTAYRTRLQNEGGEE